MVLNEISAGVLLPMGRPIGQKNEACFSAEMPRCVNSRFNTLAFWTLPMTPM